MFENTVYEEEKNVNAFAGSAAHVYYFEYFYQHKYQNRFTG